MRTEHHAFIEGDRVRSLHRDPFPDGTIVKVLENGFVLIRWDTDVLETALHCDLAKLRNSGAD
jgi:hypothetical protein